MCELIDNESRKFVKEMGLSNNRYINNAVREYNKQNYNLCNTAASVLIIKMSDLHVYIFLDFSSKKGPLSEYYSKRSSTKYIALLYKTIL